MAKAKFLHIAFHVADAATLEQLAPVFGNALDWMRYGSNCWIVWTTSSPQVWQARLKPHLPDSDYMLISTLDLSQDEYHGWLPQWAWDWISKSR